VAEPTLYLFDGYNLLHAGGFKDPRQLVDRLADFVALCGARGIVVFDGAGRDVDLGPLAVRYAANADTMLERLAAENRVHENVCLVSSDIAVRTTSHVRKVTSSTFMQGLDHVEHREQESSRLGDRVDEETRARLERLRRGED
jgi:predicted RNA-binding protein with PIN domain